MTEDIHAEFAALRSERQELRQVLERLERFEETAKAVEDGLLTLALASNPLDSAATTKTS